MVAACAGLLAPAAHAKPTATATKARRTAKTPRTVRAETPDGTLRAAVGMPTLRAGQKLSRAKAAKLLGVGLKHLGVNALLSPRTPMRGSAYMKFFCPTFVDPADNEARFSRSAVDGACGNRLGASLRFQAVAGFRYLIDCAGRPGGNVTWELRPQMNGGGPQTVSNTEHPAFIYEANATTEVRLDFHALGDEFYVQRCEITSTK